MSPGGIGNPTPPRRGPPSHDGEGIPQRGLIGRIRVFLKGKGSRTKDDPRRRPDQMDIRRAEGMYEVIPNRDAPMVVDLPLDKMAIYLDETYGPSLDPNNRNRLFAIGGFITDDPDQVDRYCYELPDALLSGSPEQRRKRVSEERRESRGRRFEKDLRTTPYKYSTLNHDRQLELRFRLNEMNERLGGMYVAKVVSKTMNPGIDEYIWDDYGNRILNESYPDSHDMYGAVLHDLLEDIQNMYPNTRFTIYLDSNTFIDGKRLEMICRDFSTIDCVNPESVNKKGALRYADMVVGASVESLKEQPVNDFATEMVSEFIINRNQRMASKGQDEGWVFLSFIPN